jgi:hypothetical protein
MNASFICCLSSTITNKKMQDQHLLDNVFYPYNFQFKIGTIHNDFVAKDATGITKSFVKQKIFKLKEHVEVFSDESRTELLYNIRANKWLDFNTTYSFTTANGENIGRLARKGWRSLWKASYELYDQNDQQDLVIREKNAWVKVADGLLSEIPIAGLFTGYLFNPSYTVSRPDGTLVATFSKRPSFFGRQFSLTQDAPFESGEEQRIHLGLMMMALLERRRG